MHASSCPVPQSAPQVADPRHATPPTSPAGPRTSQQRQGAQEAASWSWLSDEVKLHVLHMLDAEHLVMLSAVCRDLYRLTSDPLLWQGQLQQRWVRRGAAEHSEDAYGKARYTQLEQRCVQWRHGAARSTVVGRHYQRVVAIAHAHSLLVTACHDRQVRVWDWRSDKLVHAMRGHTMPITCMSQVVDQRFVITGSADASLRRWDVVLGRCVAVFSDSAAAYVRVVDYHPCGVVSGDFRVCEWDLNSARLVQQYPPHAAPIDVVRLGPRFIVSASIDRTVHVLDRATRTVARVLEHKAHVHAILPVWQDDLLWTGSCRGVLRQWDLTTGVELMRTSRRRAIRVLRATPRHVIISAGSLLHALHAQDLSLCWTFRGHTEFITDVQILPWGLVSVDALGVICTWPFDDLHAHQPPRPVLHPLSSVSALPTLPAEHPVAFPPPSGDAVNDTGEVASNPADATTTVLADAAAADHDHDHGVSTTAADHHAAGDADVESGGAAGDSADAKAGNTAGVISQVPSASSAPVVDDALGEHDAAGLAVAKAAAPLHTQPVPTSDPSAAPSTTATAPADLHVTFTASAAPLLEPLLLADDATSTAAASSLLPQTGDTGAGVGTDGTDEAVAGATAHASFRDVDHGDTTLLHAELATRRPAPYARVMHNGRLMRAGYFPPPVYLMYSEPYVVSVGGQKSKIKRWNTAKDLPKYNPFAWHWVRKLQQTRVFRDRHIYFLSLSCIVLPLWTLLLIARLDEAVDLSYKTVMLPFIVWAFLSVPSVVTAYRPRETWLSVKIPNTLAYVLFLVVAPISIAYAADGRLAMSHHSVFAPLYLGHFLCFISLVSMCVVAYRGGRRPSSNPILWLHLVVLHQLNILVALFFFILAGTLDVGGLFVLAFIPLFAAHFVIQIVWAVVVTLVRKAARRPAIPAAAQSSSVVDDFTFSVAVLFSVYLSVSFAILISEILALYRLSIDPSFPWLVILLPVLVVEWIAVCTGTLSLCSVRASRNAAASAAAAQHHLPGHHP